MPDEPPKEESPKDAPQDDERRTLLKFGVVASAVLAAGGVGAIFRAITNPTPASAGAPTTFPKVKIANVSDLKVGEPVPFNYPLDNEPNLLVKLGQAAKGGVGPDGDIVAFSQICQHLGCLYTYLPPGSAPSCNGSYKAAEPVGYCCCHGSIYDYANAGEVISGPSPRPEPQVTLQVDGAGDIYAVGMGPPTIFGHSTGSNDVSNDLVGGTPVGPSP